MSQERHILLNSGGVDSIATAALLRRDHPRDQVTSLFFDYGQRAAGFERLSARWLAMKMGFDFLPISFILPYLDKHALCDPNLFLVHGGDKVVRSNLPYEGYAGWNVPLRNLLFALTAYSYAQSTPGNAVSLWAGFDANDVETAADKTSEPHLMLNMACVGASEKGLSVPTLKTPLQGLRKHEVIDVIYDTLGIDANRYIANSWSCYNDDEDGFCCGVCAACTAVRDAFIKLGRENPINYLTAEDIRDWYGIEAEYIVPSPDDVP